MSGGPPSSVGMEEALAESQRLAHRLGEAPRGSSAAREALGQSAGVAARLVLPFSTPAAEARLRGELVLGLSNLSLALVRHAEANATELTDRPAFASLSSVQTMVARLAELGRASQPVPFAESCFLGLQRVAAAAASPHTFCPGIVASAWQHVTEACAERKEALRAVAVQAIGALAELARACASRLGEASEEKDATLCAFAAQNALKLCVRTGAGAECFPALMDAAVAARLVAGEALRDTAVPRLDGALYRTLEAAAEPQRLLTLLAGAVRGAPGPQQASCRLQLLCACTLQRAPHQSPPLRRAVLLQLLPLAWHEAASRAARIALAGPGGEADALLDGLRKGAATALRRAAADAQSQPAVWEAAQAALHAAVLSPLPLERELALLKVAGTGAARMEALRLSEIFRARVVDTTHESFVFEVSGASSKIDKFEALMKPLGLVEIARTGVLSFGRGAERG